MAANSDIVLGVTRAADAERHRAAASRLERLSGQASAVANAVAPPDDPESAWSTEVRLAAAEAARAAKPAASPPASPTGSRSEKDVYVQFEALLLHSMVEAMMPQDAEAVFGRGTAGQIWKSMLAEKVAAEIARTGSLGIAKQLASAQAIRAAAVTPTPTKAEDA